MELETDKTFEGITVGGKKFPFVRLTINSTAILLKKLRPGFWRSIGVVAATIINPQSNKKRWWKQIRSVAFVKTGAWKYFGIVPRELRCSVMLQKEAEAAEESFFAYALEIVREFNKPSNSVKVSQTENNNLKSSG
jgi:hypothetical protein